MGINTSKETHSLKPGKLTASLGNYVELGGMHHLGQSLA